MNVNSVVLVGRLVNDPEITTIGNDKPTSKATFRLAVSRIGTDKTDFIPIEVFGAQAENCKKYLVKGQETAVAGHLRIDSWQKDGKWNSRTYISAANVQFGAKPNSENSQSVPPESIETESQPDDIPF